MNHIFSLLLLTGICLSSTVWGSYFQAELPSSREDLGLGTHLILSGKGMEVKDQWLRAAHTQALVFADRNVHGNIRYIGAIENADTLKQLKKWGYQNIQVFEQDFTGPRLVQQMLQTSKIASIDMIGHNGAVLGFALESYGHRFFTNEVKALSPLTSRMSPDSFVRVMGCNTGWNLAPLLAQTLKAPVAGTFTFADIENLYNSGNWYYHDKGRFPEGETIVTKNDVSFVEPVQCSADGGCLRLKPVRINYQGKHGVYAGTVPFLKYFCGPLDTNDCFRRMALSTTYLVGNVATPEKPTQDQFISLMTDHFCPSYVNPISKKICVQSIEDHLNGKKSLTPTFTTSDGPTLNCNFQKCEAKTDCSTGTCVMIGRLDEKRSTTFVDELNAYIKGYQLLGK